MSVMKKYEDTIKRRNMIKETWEQILEDHEVRQNLSKLRQDIKVPGGKTELAMSMEDNDGKLVSLLKSEDAKTRKNAALLLGDLGNQNYLKPIYLAYEDEDQLFVKSSYLAAMANFDYTEYLNPIKKRLELLSKEEVSAENRKHVTEEIRELSSLIIAMEGVELHEFQGMKDSYSIILLTNRNFQEITQKKLESLEPKAKTKVFGAGVMAEVTNLNWIEKIRTYQELLFVVKGMETCEMDPVKAAETIIQSDLLKFMKKSHNGIAPYYFRVEFKSQMELDKKSAFTKRLSAEIERLSDRNCINTTSNYEFEIRLIENKEGGLNMLVKLYTPKDERFSYRKEFTPTSLKPVNAALTVELTKEYMKEGAQVLDPFCGAGTLLIERHKAVKANTMYGVDIQEDAILKARVNTEAAGQIIHYVNRDCFDFKHNYLFDEIITDMPFRIGRITKEDIYMLYDRFFRKAKSFLRDDGIMILYSRNADYIRQMGPENGFCIVKTYEISMKEGTCVFVLERRR